MTDIPRAPSAGAVAITATAPTVLAGGVTVFGPEAGTWGHGIKLSNSGLVGNVLSRTLTANNIYPNIKTAVGYVPANVTVVGFMVKSADLDGGSAALVQSIYIGSTEAVTGLTTGQAGTGGMYPCVPTAVTEDTLIYLNTTTAAATAQAGTVYVTALYYSS